jgi:hypothetical protein
VPTRSKRCATPPWPPSLPPPTSRSSSRSARARRRPLAARAGQPRDRCPAAAGPQGGRPARRPGPWRGQPGARERTGVLEAEHEERMLVEETVDVTLPTTAARPARGTRSPRSPSASPTSSSRWAGRSPRARGRGRVAQLRRAQPRPDHPARTMQDTFWTEPAEARPGAAHPHLAGPGPHHADPHTPDLRRLPGPGLPHRRVDATHSPVFHQVEGLVSTRASRWPTSRARSTTSPGDVRRGHHDAVPAVVLPVHRAVRRGRPDLLRLPRRRDQ